MSIRAEGTKKRRVFEVAKELKVITPTIIEFLESRGYDVSRKQMHPVSEEMYADLLHKFDKAKFKQYQSEHSTTREQTQKRDSERLRKEEIDKILAVKDSEIDAAKAKIELPKYRHVVKEQAKKDEATEEDAAGTTEIQTDLAAQEPGVKEKEIAETIAPKATHPESETTADKGETVDKAVKPKHRRSGRKGSKDKKAPDVVITEEIEAKSSIEETITAEIDEKVLSSDDLEKLAAQREDAEKKRKKIELPKFKSLKVIEQAPEKPKPAKTDARPEKKSDEKHPKLAAEIISPKKRKLKRKRIKASIESPEDAIESEVDREIAKEKDKQLKTRSVSVKETTPPQLATKKRKRRKSKPPQEKPITAAKTTKSRKRKKVSQLDVEAAIKQTMAKMEGRGKVRRRHTHAADDSQGAEPEALKVMEFITTQELADTLEVPVQDLIRRCLEMGMIISINQRLEKDVIELLAAEFNAEVEFVKEEELAEAEEEIHYENLEKRPPIVTVMGHVDHGKTTLLDYLRHSTVAQAEVGGITQHIGAYEVTCNDERITFLDTPGHEAFTAMRARGAQLTDIVVLVVAADDRVMPQTIEAIDHARAAGTPIVVAVNKIDKPAANTDNIYKQLADHNVLVEKWGGNYQSAEISAKFGQGIDDLLSEILVAADILDLKADPIVKSSGVVVESRLDKGLGAVATVLVQVGTLKVGDSFVVGQHYGRIRAMYNERGEPRESAPPSTPSQVVGFNGVPQAGDKLVVYPSEKAAREVSQRRQRQHRELSIRQIRALSLDQANRQMKEMDVKELPLIIKGDVHGSVEVLSDALMKLSTGEVKVHIIHRGVGGITESDVLLAAASSAEIIGFHVHPNIQARELARKEKVDIRLHRIIHEVVDQTRKYLEGMLAPIEEEHVTGSVEIRKIFKINKVGIVAGSYVTEGKITRSSKVRLLRDSVELWTGDLSSLKRFKDDVREVTGGFECGLSLDGYRNIQEGDVIQAFEIIETSRKLGFES